MAGILYNSYIFIQNPVSCKGTKVITENPKYHRFFGGKTDFCNLLDEAACGQCDHVVCVSVWDRMNIQVVSTLIKLFKIFRKNRKKEK